MVKKGPWWFWSVGRGVLQEAPGQKGPLVVLERRARGPPRGPWIAPGQKGPLVVLERRARGPPRGPWSKRAPDDFGAWAPTCVGEP